MNLTGLLVLASFIAIGLFILYLILKFAITLVYVFRHWDDVDDINPKLPDYITHDN